MTTTARTITLQPLEDRKALVTGADSGIGNAIAIALGQAGGDVVVRIPDRRAGSPSEERLAETPRAMRG
jgi:glucose 1-dehydrogenase